VVSCLFFLIFLVERIGRRGSLLGGSFMMGVFMIIVAILTAVFPPNKKAGMTSTSLASLIMIYLEAGRSSANGNASLNCVQALTDIASDL
jgi:hypothetical protein